MIVVNNTRHTVEVDLKDIANIKDVQSLIIKGSMADGRVFRVDIGRLCYTKRDQDVHNYFHSYSQYAALRVDYHSLSSERCSGQLFSDTIIEVFISNVSR